MGRVEGLAPTLDVWLEAGGGQKLEEVVGRGRRLEAAGCWMLEDEGDRGRDEDGERRLDDGGGWRRLDVGVWRRMRLEGWRRWLGARGCQRVGGRLEKEHGGGCWKLLEVGEGRKLYFFDVSWP